MIATSTSIFRIWRKRMLSAQYGYDVISPMSPSTLKIEHHDPGGLLWWEDLAELSLNMVILCGTIYVSCRIDPAFGALWTLLCLLIAGPVAALSGLRLRFKFFRRRPESVTVRYEPANIPTELIDRYLGPSPTTKIGLTGVFLDPPYAVETRADVYPEESRALSREVREWAITHGSNPDKRIALFGYEGEHEMPCSWTCVAWKANGGYGNQGDRTRGRENARKERIWFSPYCLRPQQSLFDTAADSDLSGVSLGAA